MAQHANPLSPDLLRLKKMGRETILKSIAMDRETERRRAKLAANKVESKRCYTQLEELMKKAKAHGTKETEELEVIFAQVGGGSRKAELEDWMAKFFASDQEAREAFRAKSAECWNLGS